jgi:glutaredoxin
MRAWMGVIAALGIYTLQSWDAGAQQLYRWVDKDGRVHYTQVPPPRGAAKNVQPRNLGSGSPVESSEPSYVLQQAMKNYPVMFYTAPNCKEGCPETRQLLDRRGVPYREINVADQRTSDALKTATGDNNVPALVVGSRIQVGYVPQAMQNLLDAAGYPRTPAFTGKPPAPPPLPEALREAAGSPPPAHGPLEAASAPSETPMPHRLR